MPFHLARESYQWSLWQRRLWFSHHPVKLSRWGWLFSTHLKVLGAWYLNPEWYIRYIVVCWCLIHQLLSFVTFFLAAACRCLCHCRRKFHMLSGSSVGRALCTERHVLIYLWLYHATCLHFVSIYEPPGQSLLTPRFLKELLPRKPGFWLQRLSSIYLHPELC